MNIRIWYNKLKSNLLRRKHSSMEDTNGNLSADEPKKTLTDDKWELSADDPKKSLTDDKLGRKPYVEYLVQLFRGHQGKSIVVGIDGKWGAGKTTFIYFLKEKMDEINDLNYLDFNPWIYDSTKDIKISFVNLLQEKISCRSSTEAFVKYIKKLFFYGTYHTQQYKIVILIILTVMYLVIFFVFSFNVINIKAWLLSFEWIINNKTLLKYLYNSFPFIIMIVNLVMQYDKKINQDLDYKEFKEEYVHTKLTNRLFKGKMVIFIDDLDRVDFSKVEIIFSLIKTFFLNFNNLIFVLAYDSGYLKKSINNNYPDIDAEEYLEKIIQLPIELLPIESSYYKREIVEILNSVFKRHMEGIVYYIDSYKYSIDNIAMLISKLIETPRIIQLLKNKILSKELIIKEVNPIDLVILSFIEIYRNDIYQILKSEFSLKPDPRKDLFNIDRKYYFKPIIDGLEDRNPVEDCWLKLGIYPEDYYFYELVSILFHPQTISDKRVSKKDILEYKKIRINFENIDYSNRFFYLYIKGNTLSLTKIGYLFSEKSTADELKQELGIRILSTEDIIEYFRILNTRIDLGYDCNNQRKSVLIKFCFDLIIENMYYYEYDKLRLFLIEIMHDDQFYYNYFEIDADYRLLIIFKIFSKEYSTSGSYSQGDKLKLVDHVGRKELTNEFSKFSKDLENNISEFSFYLAYLLFRTEVDISIDLSEKIRDVLHNYVLSNLEHIITFLIGDEQEYYGKNKFLQLVHHVKISEVFPIVFNTEEHKKEFNRELCKVVPTLDVKDQEFINIHVKFKI